MELFMFSASCVRRLADHTSFESSLYTSCDSINPYYVGDLLCNDYNNNENCDYDGGDCCECKTITACQLARNGKNNIKRTSSTMKGKLRSRCISHTKYMVRALSQNYESMLVWLCLKRGEFAFEASPVKHSQPSFLI